MDPSTEEGCGWLEALRQRERKAWALVYEEYADAVYRHAYYRLGDRAAAEDVTQEVFIRAIESIAAYSGGRGSFVQWLRGIARRVMAQRMKSLWVEQRGAEKLGHAAAAPASRGVTATLVLGDGEAGDPSFELADSRPLPDELLIRREEERLTGLALTALPPHWERALRWKYCDGVRVEEIGRRLAVTVKAAESLLSRARAAFRTAYGRFLKAGNGHLLEIEEWRDE